MILECNRCEATVEALELYSYVDDERGEDPVPGKWTLCKCPKCTLPLLVVQVDMGDGWDAPSRVYPAREKELGWSVPKPIREAFKEASKCMRVKAYTASAIMCRKTLEGLCVAHGVRERNLSSSLKRLKESGFIENRLFEWAEELRTLGNEAAHGVDRTVSAQDAKDMMEFTEALCEYVFTYRDKFERFKKRRSVESNPDSEE